MAKMEVLDSSEPEVSSTLLSNSAFEIQMANRSVAAQKVSQSNSFSSILSSDNRFCEAAKIDLGQ